ncbi:MAG: XdhC family protein [Ktedonobacterales bacterium]
MREVMPEVEQWLTSGEQIAVARVISVVGSAPRGLGATLAINENGGISGSVSGGCVEPAVIEEGMRSIRTGKPRLLTFGITEEQNLEQIGLSCGGEIRVFVERLERSDVTLALLRALQFEEPTALATVISAPPGRSQLVGGQLLVTMGPRGKEAILGTLDQTPLERSITTDAYELLQRGECDIRRYSEPGGAEHSIEVFYGVFPAPPRLVIVGAGHISMPLTKLAKVLGYHVIVVDAREAFATRERFPDADDVLVEWPDEALGRLIISANTSIAVLTHDDKFDVPALAAALRSPANYVGVIGSRGTREQREQRLREVGITTEEISRIYGPIGLAIGAKTPEEIALAILAQMVAVRHGARLAKEATPTA